MGQIYLEPTGGRNTHVPEKPSQEMRKNNPQNKPVGDFTGRCHQCGSTNLWDDMTAYGCNGCGMIRFTG